jgi:hypothetical protein
MMNSVSMVGVSAAIRDVEDEINHAARCSAKVLITGESGVGKEIVARLIHERSARSRGSLVTINCAGFPDSLLESELFGHVKGSFTDAHRDKRGWFEAAHGGTVFMDEIGEMSLRMQALLLRFLETGEIQRVGADRILQSVDVRVIAATHRRLLDHIADKSFREDLYYRLNVVHIEVPPLRERREDIGLLLNHFLGNFSAETRRSAGTRRSTTTLGSDAPLAATKPQVLFERMCKEGASFWSEVYEPFMARDLTRSDVREVVRLGLEDTRGNYKMLVGSFNMPPEDYKKFLNFLRKYQCHVPFQSFRIMPPSLARDSARVATV